MISRTQVLSLIKDLRWKEVRAGLLEQPDLAKYRDQKGRNLLHICCGVNPREKSLPPGDSVRTAEVLLDAGIDVNQEAFRDHNWKATPLWYAISRGENLTLAKFLLQRGSDPIHCLWSAAFRDDVQAIKLLVQSGADIDPVTEDETPFLSAVKVSHFPAARALLELGAGVNFQDSRGMTALHYMLKKGSDKRYLRMIIQYGTRGDLASANGETAIDIMLRKRDPDFRSMAKQLSITG